MSGDPARTRLTSGDGAAPAGGRWAEAVALLQRLVRTPSLSGREAAAAEVLAEWGRGRGLAVEVDELAVRFAVRAASPGQRLVLASHLDTVPPGEGWKFDPWSGAVEAGRVLGRGAVDAKASVAAMAVAVAALAEGGGPRRGSVELWATFSEETRDTTMPRLVEREGLPDAAIVGEPTGLRACTAQRGQVLLRLSWSGEQMHAGWAAAADPPPANAILAACGDLSELARLEWGEPHPTLGGVAVTPTLIEGGVARNVTPPRCAVVLDVRTTPAVTHATVIERVRAAVGAEVEVLSDRLLPAETPPGSALLAALRRVRPGIEEVASPTCSDWVFLSRTDAVKLGPGESRRSHTVDEWIAADEVEQAAGLYLGTIEEMLQ